ncbi:MAG: helix-turn-helix domain-containing protein, partial [Bullifex sp.]
TDSAYIQAEQVEKCLEAEKTKLTSSLALSSVIDINKKMSEIEKDIARAVLLKTNGNQSQAAQKLGISRTTMWRLLS